MTIGLVVVDTNIVVNGLVTRDPKAPTARVLNGMLRRAFVFLISVELLAEYRSVLLRPKIASLHGLTAEEVDDVLTDIAANAIVRETGQTDETPPDRNDPQHLWSLLATQAGSVLVTGDQALLDNSPTASSTLSARAFVELVENAAG